MNNFIASSVAWASVVVECFHASFVSSCLLVNTERLETTARLEKRKRRREKNVFQKIIIPHSHMLSHHSLTFDIRQTGAVFPHERKMKF